MDRISYADLSNNLLDAMHLFNIESGYYFYSTAQWAFAWLEAIGPQEFLEMMED